MLVSIELKLHSMFIRFILNIFHYNWTKIKNVELLVHLTFKKTMPFVFTGVIFLLLLKIYNLFRFW